MKPFNFQNVGFKYRLSNTKYLSNPKYLSNRWFQIPFKHPYTAVAAFYVGNALGIPFVDRPVTVDTLAAAAVAAVGDASVSGILDYTRMEELGS